MKLKSLLLRYYPPGIMLEYEKGGELKTKSIDLLELSPSRRDPASRASDHSVPDKASQTPSAEASGETQTA
uniref:Dynein assembly factor with WDR repeat domains 1 n=1 Tax=Mus musculus TaxID=10090 RepID=D6REG5_MOUSE